MKRQTDSAALNGWMLRKKDNSRQGSWNENKREQSLLEWSGPAADGALPP